MISGPGLRIPALGLIAMLLLPLAGAGVAGDRDVAGLLFDKAEKAARARSYEEAASLYGRALKEFSPYPEAAYGLAVVLEKQGKTKEALDAYLLCRDQIAELESPSRKVRSLDLKAESAVKRLGTGYAELHDIDREFVRACVALGRRYVRTSPGWAKRALEAALEIDPDNELARSTLAKLGDVASPTEIAGAFVPLTDDRLSRWDPGCGDAWSCRGGVITGDTHDTKGHVNTLKERFEGTYALRATFRVTRPDEKHVHGLFFGDKPDRTAWALVVSWDDELVLSRWVGSERTEKRMKILTGFDASGWHTLGLDVTPGKVVCLLDGKPELELAGEAEDAFDGNPMIFIQNIGVEIKDVGARR